MAVTYKRLFHLMIDRNISNTELISKAGVSANIFTRMKRNQYIALDSIEKICSVLDCQVDDILEFTSDGSDDQSKGDAYLWQRQFQHRSLLIPPL